MLSKVPRANCVHPDLSELVQEYIMHARFHLLVRRFDFASNLQTILAFLSGGAPFPDYLYECGDNHNAGEAAHWFEINHNAPYPKVLYLLLHFSRCTGFSLCKENTNFVS